MTKNGIRWYWEVLFKKINADRWVLTGKLIENTSALSLCLKLINNVRRRDAYGKKRCSLNKTDLFLSLTLKT